MNKDKIYCYSGTGNCLAFSKQLGKELDMDVEHITYELAESAPHIAGERCIIIFPAYAYGMPRTVCRFIKKSTFDVKYMAVLSTFGSSPGGAYAQCIRMLRRRGQKTAYSGGTRSVENYVHMFKLPPEERIAELQKSQHDSAVRFAEIIKAGICNKRLLFRPFSAFVYALFDSVTPTLARRYKFTKACTDCNLCHRICPANAITPAPDPKIDPKKCDHCQSCLHLCPHRAICYYKVQPDSRRYCHKDTTPKDFFKR